ncbi:MAG: dimethylarginine dimethylaminohydrolase family protein [Patescibacteria group bacterium]|jgi:N-dimethylarginine dimethylaminohydrolase
MAKIIKKVLLCPPDYFQIRYQINPWMKTNNPINQPQAKAQWTKLVSLCQSLGIEVETISPKANLPDMVFTADQGLVKNNLVVLARFRHQQRQPETKVYQKWFKNRGFQTLHLPKGFYFEGGDALEVGNKIIIGHGFRTSPKSLPAIAKLLKTPVVGLKLISPRFYHLDTCLFVLNPKTAFYYPRAFAPASRKKLNHLFPNLVNLPQKEAQFLATNSLNTDHQVIIQKKTPIFARKLYLLGYQVHQVNVDEFTKAGGGIHCLAFTTQAN